MSGAARPTKRVTAPGSKIGNAMNHRQYGFTYLGALFLVAVLAILAARAVEVTATHEQRAREADLLWVGATYREAIRQYYLNTPGYQKRYPASLNALLLDQRPTRATRPLRKLYRDPMTGSDQWGIIESSDGDVMGIYSLSTRRPFKVDGFGTELHSLSTAKTYQDWKFSFEPN